MDCMWEYHLWMEHVMGCYGNITESINEYPIQWEYDSNHVDLSYINAYGILWNMTNCINGQY